MSKGRINAMKNCIYDWKDIDNAINSLFSDIYSDKWKPDVAVGIIPDSAVISNILSNRLETKFETIKIDLFSKEPEVELNCWLPELAFGVNDSSETGISGARWDPQLRKNILVCVTQNKAGILERLINDWQDACYPAEKQVWQTVWHRNVRFASMIDYSDRDINCDYTWKMVDPSEKTKDIFPWDKSFWTQKI